MDAFNMIYLITFYVMAMIKQYKLRTTSEGTILKPLNDPSKQ